MPDRCASRCSTVTSSAISGRSFAEHRPGGGREVERAALDQAHHGQRGEALRPARRREQGVDRVGDLVAPVGETVGQRELRPRRAVDADDAGEPGPLGRGVDGVLQGAHLATVAPVGPVGTRIIGHMPRLLIVHHSPTDLVRSITERVVAGANDDAIEGVEVVVKEALEARADDVLAADGYLLGTTANFGYMSGALKHFFDSIFLEAGGALSDDGSAGASGGGKKPYGLYVHGRYDTTGAVRSVQSIVGGTPLATVGRGAGAARRRRRRRVRRGVRARRDARRPDRDLTRALVRDAVLRCPCEPPGVANTGGPTRRNTMRTPDPHHSALAPHLSPRPDSPEGPPQSAPRRRQAADVCHLHVNSVTSYDLNDGDGHDEIKIKLGDGAYLGPWSMPDDWTRNDSLGVVHKDFTGSVERGAVRAGRHPHRPSTSTTSAAPSSATAPWSSTATAPSTG